MAIFGNKKGGLMDEIRCDEQTYLIWKWHPKGTSIGESDRENAIRWGSSIRVKDGEMAVFVYKQPDGNMMDYIVGPRDDVLKTSNLPVLSNIIGLAYNGGTPFQAEVYFINLARIIQTKFAVPYFDVFDPRYPDFSVPVAVRGTINFQITNFAEFIQLNRLQNFSLDDFQKQIKDVVNRYIKNLVADAPAKNNVPVIQLESKISQINDEVERILSKRLQENFGITVSAVDIGAIDIDKTSEGYSQLIAITKNVTAETIHAEAQANIKNIHDKQRIEADNYEEILRMNREETQYATRKNTQMKNLAAYQLEIQGNVGVAGAEALGQMGANGGGNMGEMNPAGMMAGLAVGGAIGQNIAGTMNNIMGTLNQQSNDFVSAANQTPPPIQTPLFNVAVNGQATGPFDINTLSSMISTGEFDKESLVWTNGMENWMKAEEVEALKGLFSKMPPIPKE